MKMREITEKSTMRKLCVNTYAYANESNPWAGAPLRHYIEYFITTYNLLFRIPLKHNLLRNHSIKF